MHRKRKSNVTRIIAVVLAIMLVAYNFPAGALLPVFAEGEAQDVFTLQILEGVNPVEVNVHNMDNAIDVTRSTDENGVVQFPELTDTNFGENNEFEFTVGEARPFKILLSEGTTDHYTYNVNTEELKKVVVKENYQVTVNKTGEGLVIINGHDYTAPVPFEEGTRVEVEITPAANYEIKAVKIGEETKTLTESEKVGYKATIDSLSDNTNIDIEFALKTYTITFDSYQNGEVRDQGNQLIDTKGGTVQVQHGSDSSFTVKPTTGHHIEGIVIDGKPFDFEPDQDGNYTYTFTEVDQNHYVKVTFQINTYAVSASVIGGGGEVELDKETVDYNGNAVVTINPYGKFRLDSLTINGTIVPNDKIVENKDDDNLSYTVESITADTTIEVKFASIPFLEGTWSQYVSISPEPVQTMEDGNFRIYSKDADVRIKPIAPFTHLDIDPSNTFWQWNKEYKISESTSIERLLVKTKGFFFEKNEGEVKLTSPLKLVFDTQSPIVDEPQLTGENKKNVDDAVWYSGLVTVSGVIKNGTQNFDTVDYATDIDKVYYSEGTSYADRIEADFDPVTNRYSFKTEDKDYQGVYSIWAVDKAGNLSEVKQVNINIDKTVPTLENGEAVTFVQKNTSQFASVLNFLTFGTFFNKEIEVTVKVKDDASGIQGLTLKTNDEKVVPEMVADSFEKDGLTAKATFRLDVEKFKGTFHVDVTDNVKNNKVYLVTKDNSNMKADNSGVTLIEKNPPSAKITVQPKENVASNGDEYNGDVAFDIAVQDGATLDEDESGVNSVSIYVNDNLYKEYDFSATKENRPAIASVKTDDLEKNIDGKYHVSVNVIDNAGNTNTVEKTIYIDKTSPKIIDFTFSTIADNGQYEKVEENVSLRDSVELTDYGYFFNKHTQVTVTAEDPKVDYEYTSQVKSMTVYLKDYENGKYFAVLADGSLKEISEAEVEGIAPVSTTDELTFNVPEAFKGQIFAKATDHVQNTGAYETPDGTVIENEKQHAKESHIQFEKEKTTNRDGQQLELFSHNVDVKLTVTDTYSGLSEIEWSVIAPYDTANNQSGKLKINNDQSFTADSQTEGWGITKTDKNLITEVVKTIPVTQNSNNIVIKVKVTDRAGNTSEDEISFSIDKTAPTIQVSYDNNSADAENADYYKADRTATIEVTERNFKAEDVIHQITNTDGTIPNVVGWTTKANPQDPDKTTHTATVKYTADGDYTFDIQYKDSAGNAAPLFAQQTFTIDKTIPVIKVAYDNNQATNGNYFKAGRSATISVTEHNFDPRRIRVTGTAAEGGQPMAFPQVSGWTANGDVHTATIRYAADGEYSFDIDFMDMAGNISADYKMEEFIVDQTAPELTISGVQDQSANNGDVAPVITYSDRNFNKEAASIRLTGANHGEAKLNGQYSEVANGQVFMFNNFEKTKENDDLYTLTAKLTDYAGNETTQTIRFSVNRFGSVYAFDDSLKNLDGKYVKDEIDVILTETNVDSLKPETVKVKLTKNGTPSDLVEGKDYSVTETGGEGQWSQYEYVIKKELFAGDGRYNVALFSEDAAGNINETIDETKKAEISFGIDKTAPVIVPIDIENGEQYPLETKSAAVSIKDNLVLDETEFFVNGKKVEHKAEGENFTFEIQSDNAKQDVKIVAIDAAGNRLTKEVSDLLVSTNPIVRWYNNTPLFAGSLGGVGAVIISISSFLLYRHRMRRVIVEKEVVGG
ncbi:Ig-like domain-containing protein [Neobacillus sp. K501]